MWEMEGCSPGSWDARSIPGASLGIPEHPWVSLPMGGGAVGLWPCSGAHGDSLLSLCSPQPDLGAGRREGQLLAVLHHRDGRRHEHLGCQGEVSPRYRRHRRLGASSVEPSLATALIAIPPPWCCAALCCGGGSHPAHGGPKACVGISFNTGLGGGHSWVASLAHHQRWGVTPALCKDPAPSPGFSFAHTALKMNQNQTKFGSPPGTRTG